MNAVYLPEGKDYIPQPGEVVIRTRDVPKAQNDTVNKVTEALGSTFGPHSFVKPETPNN